MSCLASFEKREVFTFKELLFSNVINHPIFYLTLSVLSDQVGIIFRNYKNVTMPSNAIKRVFKTAEREAKGAAEGKIKMEPQICHH